MPPKKKVIVRKKARSHKLPPILVRRGGADEASQWRVVNRRPRIGKKRYSNAMTISANIAVNKNAEKQSEIEIVIPEDRLIDLFEKHFEIQTLGIGDLIRLLKKSQRIACDLVTVIDNIRCELSYSTNSSLKRIKLDEEVFDKDALHNLEKAKKQNWFA
jgi:hypothetical protein